MPPAVAIVGWSGSGKTTLILELIRVLTKRGYRVGAVKHTHHTEVKIDEPGKDSYEMKAAGAPVVALVTPQKWVLVRELTAAFRMDELIERHFSDLDLVLVEGFKDAELPKILIERDGSERLLLYNLIAVLRFPFEIQKKAEELADLLEARFLK